MAEPTKPTRDPTIPPPILLEDSMLVTYLKQCGHPLIPVISRDDPSDPRVAWDPEACNQDELESDIRKFYNDVNLQAFITVFKAVKSEMYALKRVRKLNN